MQVGERVTLKPVDYDRHQHTVYAKARAISPQMLAEWMRVFGEELPPHRPLSILDLGSGTGRFSPALAESFGGPVVGVEPSEGMRASAEQQAAHPRVTYLAGEAARIPLGDGSVDAVLMFLSFHHVRDKAVAAHEIARVLKPDGRVLLRGVFSDRPPPTWYHAYFPRLLDIERAMFPTLEAVLELFGQVGMHMLALREIDERYHATEQEAVDLLRLRGISTFDHLTERELSDGFARLDADIAKGDLRAALTARSDLLVLAR